MNEEQCVGIIQGGGIIHRFYDTYASGQEIPFVVVFLVSLGVGFYLAKKLRGKHLIAISFAYLIVALGSLFMAWLDWLWYGYGFILLSVSNVGLNLAFAIDYSRKKKPS